jgi:pimeloyl-ACP methyl ester carboxylesterase
MGWPTRRSISRPSCSTTATGPVSPAWSPRSWRERCRATSPETTYWLTNTGVSAARLYWENKADFFDAKAITIPFAISVFPDELYQAPRSWAERAYPDNLIHYNRLDRGGHFAAWEQPQLFSEELRAAFRSLRQ